MSSPDVCVRPRVVFMSPAHIRTRVYESLICAVVNDSCVSGQPLSKRWTGQRKDNIGECSGVGKGGMRGDPAAIHLRTRELPATTSRNNPTTKCCRVPGHTLPSEKHALAQLQHSKHLKGVEQRSIHSGVSGYQIWLYRSQTYYPPGYVPY